jgi:hypothetical protein
MASKRNVRRHACEGKVRHASPRAALAALGITANRLARSLGRHDLNIYRCGFCHGWHVGHIQHTREHRGRRY